jgi:alcohol dehydrogenase (NADP+)
MLGIPDEPIAINPFFLETKRLSIAGSLVGGIDESQEMLDFCASRGIAADVETIPIHEINTAHERLLKNDVKYRFVIDMASLQ